MPTKKVTVVTPGTYVDFRVPFHYNRITIVTASGIVSVKDANNNINDGLPQSAWIDYAQVMNQGNLSLTSTVVETVLIHWGLNEKVSVPPSAVPIAPALPAIIPQQVIPAGPGQVNIPVPGDYKKAVITLDQYAPGGFNVIINLFNAGGQPMSVPSNIGAPPNWGVYYPDGTLAGGLGQNIALPGAGASANVTFIVPLGGASTLEITDQSATVTVRVNGQFTNGDN